jgi:hypothetical protein
MLTSTNTSAGAGRGNRNKNAKGTIPKSNFLILFPCLSIIALSPLSLFSGRAGGPLIPEGHDP